MSNFLYGTIIMNDTDKNRNSYIKLKITEFCSDSVFAIQVIDTIPTKSTERYINFRLSDNMHVKYCEFFMEPIIYLEGKPQLDCFCRDVEELQKLMETIFEFEKVERVELRFSWGEIIEEDYEIYEINLEEMKKMLLSIYLSTTDFPCANLIIHQRNHL